MENEEMTITVKLDEFRKLYQHKTILESLVRYTKMVKNNEPFEFMVDDLLRRGEECLKHYNDVYEKEEDSK